MADTTRKTGSDGITEKFLDIGSGNHARVVAIEAASSEIGTELTTADLDTGAGTDTRAVVGLVGTASGGGQLIPGSATDGLLVNLGTNNDVALDAASLAALETITVALDAASLAALESITATGPLTDTQLRATAVPVSAASLPLPSGASTSALQGGGLPAALAVGGGLKVEGVAGGVAQPVSGTVAATQSGTWTEANSAAIAASASVLDDWDETNRAAVNLIAGQVGIAGGAGAVAATVPRVTLASDDPAVALLTTIDADTGAIAAGFSTETTLASIAAGVKQNDAAWGATHYGFAGYGIRDDALSALGVVENDYTPLRLDANGATWVQLAGALAASVDSVAVGSLAGQGASWAQFIDVDETEDEVKATSGTIHDIVVTNVSAGIRYLKLYDGTAAGVVVGTTTPKWTIAIPIGAGFVWHSDYGLACATGITIAATTGVAVADVGAPGANDVVVNIGYK